MKAASLLSLVSLALLAFGTEAKPNITCHPVGKPGPFVGLTSDNSVQHFDFRYRHGSKELTMSDNKGPDLQFYECSTPSKQYRPKNFTSPDWYAGQLRLKSDPSQCVAVGNVTISQDNVKTNALEPVPDPHFHDAGIRLVPCAKGDTQDMRLQWWGMANTTKGEKCDTQLLVITGWKHDFTYGGYSNGINDLNVKKSKTPKTNQTVDIVYREKFGDESLFANLGLPTKECRKH